MEMVAMRKRANAVERATEGQGEPVGIVISNGPRHDEAPRFSAYVWGPVPEAEVEHADTEELVAVA
jgi:hypothetical protein